MHRSLGAGSAFALFLLFVLSGATSLVYQVLWVRQLSLVLGSTLHAISAVVGAFMAGLALGSAVLGPRVDRWGSPLRLYALLEGAIGLCALAVPVAFDALLSSSIASGWAPFAISFLLLLIPTALMGGTLPALARFVSSFPGSRGRLIGLLYALNTAGAILGAALTGFVLIRALGIRNTNLVAALCNLGILVAGLLLAKLTPTGPDATPPPPSRSPQTSGDLLIPVTVAYFVSGFVGLGLEVLWTRAVLLFSGNTIYAFTVILTTFLVGIALGSSVMSALLHRIENAVGFLAGLHCSLGLVAGGTPLVLAALGVPLFEWVQELAAPRGLAAQTLSTYAVSVVFILPATILMGATFPLVAHLVTRATPAVGRVVGRVYATNTLGAVLGSLVSSLVFLPMMGIQRSIFLFGLLTAGAGVYLAWRARSKVCLRFTSVGALAVGFVFVLAPNSFQAMLEDSLGVQLTRYAEGLETTVGVYDSPKANRPVLLINNVALDDHGVVHKMLAHIPMLLHPDPQRGLVLGFGVGITSQSLASHHLAVNDCVEISQDVMDAAPWFAGLNGGIAEGHDTRFRVFVADGRRFLLAHPEPYDLIALDANSGKLRNAGVGKLYTREFFELCRDRLTPDGLITAYVSPNGTLREFKMIVRTFLSVFPHTSLWVDPVHGETCVLLGSRQPLHIDMDRYLSRIRQPDVQADLMPFDLDSPGMLLSAFHMGEGMVQLFAQDGEVNTDDRPIMEFYPLDMGLFDVDDSALSAVGLPLYEESVLGVLKEGWQKADADGEILDELVSAERATPSLFRAWEARRSLRVEESQEWLRLAASLHPEDESLRTQLGHGRVAASEAAEQLRREVNPENLARAGLLASRRNQDELAIRLIEAALAERIDEQKLGATRGELHRAAATSAARLRDVTRCRTHLIEAEGYGQDVRLLRARLDYESQGVAAAPQILSELGRARIEVQDLPETLKLLVAMGESGVASSDLVMLLGETLETCGDDPGAFLAFHKAARSNPSGATRERAAALRLGLRLDVARKANGVSVDPGFVLTSRFGAGRVRQVDLPVVDHRDPRPWILLSRIYQETAQPLLAYQLARASRTMAPENVESYLAVAQAALLNGGGRSIAVLALEHAQGIAPEDQRVQLALRHLKDRP